MAAELDADVSDQNMSDDGTNTIVQCVVTMYESDHKTVKERFKSRVGIHSTSHTNLVAFQRHLVDFLGLKSFGLGDFDLKIYRMQMQDKGKADNFLIQTQCQWDLERQALINSCGELNGELWLQRGLQHIFIILFCM